MYQIVYYLLFIPVLIYGLYFLITGLFAFKENKKKIKNHDAKHKFAVLIASRNEENVIANLIDSLQRQDYPTDLYDVIVLPNNCTDHTEQVAKKAGAKIMQVKTEVTCKGDVLKYAFEKLVPKSTYDAFVIFDADNVVHPDFLKRMNDALVEGHEVAQGFRDSKNPGDNWICGSYSLFYWGQNIFFNEARMRINGSASINGTGFMIKKSVIAEIGFNPKTMTEDMEFTAQCALHGKKIVFIKDAITYDEQPLKFAASWKQRKRWSIGTYQCLYNYSKKLIIQAFKTKKLACLDMALFFMAPIVQLVGFFLFIVLAIYNLIGIRLSDIFAFMMAYKEFFFVLTYFISVIFATFVVKYCKKDIKKTFSGILGFPLFLFSWIPINIICLFKKKLTWEPIAHDRNVELDSLITKKK